jgi:hypothetical protein
MTVYVDKWRPIETAPKDGTRIILYQPGGDGDDPSRTTDIGAWGRWEGASWCWVMTAGDGWVRPTHWMPLPEKPTNG